MRKGAHYDDAVPKLVHSPSTVQRLELLAASCQSQRAVLLEGTTASGKTALVQELARLAKRELVVIPMNQDVETSDLIGQWLPVTAAEGYAGITEAVSAFLADALAEIVTLVLTLLSGDELIRVTRNLSDACMGCGERRWALEGDEVVYTLNGERQTEADLRTAERAAAQEPEPAAEGAEPKPVEAAVRTAEEDAPLLEAMLTTLQHVVTLPTLPPLVLKMMRSKLAEGLRIQKRLTTLAGAKDQKVGFEFVESQFITAIRRGQWVLLDNINSAPPDVIERCARA